VTIDIASVAARTAMLVAMLQACGIALFLAAFGRQLTNSRRRVRRAGAVSIAVALGALVAFYLLEAGRMAGEFAGVLDGELLTLVAQSNAAPAALRVLGLGAVLVCVAVHRLRTVGVIGAALVALSFASTGHTVEAVPRGLAALLVVLHVGLASAWFGALLPLVLVARDERPSCAASVVVEFSRLALWTVPLIAVAGVALAWLLGVRWAALDQSYAQLLMLKASAFALLMVLAAANKWRYGPQLAHGDRRAAVGFRRTVTIEYGLIVGVVATTATLTTFHAPAG
jgi:putative copper export protein